MKLSTRTRYGTRALLELSLYYGKGLVLLKDIAQRQQISLAYLDHIIKPLITAGIVRTSRGMRGGISLSKPPEDIRLSEVIRLLEGSVNLAECINSPEVCSLSGSCVTRDLWSEMGNAMNGVVEETTLQNLVDRYRSKQGTQSLTYEI